jgi:hypothetical protein
LGTLFLDRPTIFKSITMVRSKISNPIEMIRGLISITPHKLAY